MAENLYCEESGCEQPARVFGFVGQHKLKLCEAHILTLVHKQATLYDITAFSFIQSRNDGPMYEERRAIVQKGLGNLTSLETQCEKDWKDWQTHLEEGSTQVYEMVQTCFKEMWLRGQEHYGQIKSELGTIRSHLEQILLDQTFQLSPEETAICDSGLTGPLLCVIMNNSRLPEAIMGTFHPLVWDVKGEKLTDWTRKVHFADKQAGKIQEKHNETLQFQSLFPTTAKYEAEECLKTAQTASRVGDFEKALKELQRGRNSLHRIRSLELYLQLSNGIIEVYHQTGDWGNTVSVCQDTLSMWTSGAASFPYLQTIYYLSNAYYRLDQFKEGFSIVEEWTVKLSPTSLYCQCVLCCIQAQTLRVKGRKREAEQLYDQAFRLDPSPSYINLCSRRDLARIYTMQGRIALAEGLYLHICELYPAHYPHSQSYAGCLLTLGSLSMNRKRTEDAEQYYQRSIQLYSHFPPSKHYANGFYNLGLLYRQGRRLQEALQQFETARAIYIELGATIDAYGCNRIVQLLSNTV